MYAKRIATVVLMSVLLGLVGCAATKKEDVYVPPYSERTKVVQPTVSRETFEELSKKQLPLYIGTKWKLYDASIIGRIIEERKESGKVHFTTDPNRFPLLKGPPPFETAEFLGLYKVFLKKELENNDFQVVDVPCKNCLEVVGPFAYYFYSGKGDVFQGAYVLASPTMKLGGEVVLVTPDDFIAKGRRLRMEYTDIAAVAELVAYRSARELRHFWDETYGSSTSKKK